MAANPEHERLASDPNWAHLVVHPEWSDLVADSEQLRLAANHEWAEVTRSREWARVAADLEWKEVPINSCSIRVGDDGRVLEHDGSEQRVHNQSRIAFATRCSRHPEIENLARFPDVSGVVEKIRRFSRPPKWPPGPRHHLVDGR